MAIVDRHWRRLSGLWRVVGVLGVCLVMTPVWIVLTPVGWASFIGCDGNYDLIGAAVTLCGSLAVGAMFLLLARLRGKPPAVWFALLLPAIGIGASGILSMIIDGQGPFLSGLALYWFLGFIWLYGLAALFALPAAFAQTALMILVANA